MDQRTLHIARPAIGLVQGLMLLALYRAAESQSWQASDPQMFAPLVIAALFVPLIAISGLGNMRPATLIGWLIAATVLCLGLAFYDIARDPTDMTRISDAFPSGAPRNMASFPFWPSLAAMLFVAHALVLASDTDRRVVAGYQTYFEASWKHGIQGILGALFVGVFWAILFLGAGLFALIKITALSDLIKHDFFWIPVTALATGYALHLTDVRATLTRGARSLVLFLLSWLLPVMTLLALGFVVALPFAGLEALWSTRHAGAILLATCAMLVFLINTAYQDGQTDQPLALRVARLAASLALLPLTALAAYALLLRVQQYGWSPDRVIAAACTVMATFYALGYLYAAARFGLALRGLELVNTVTAMMVVIILLALLTPALDPARVSVDSQIARLQSGKVPPDKFDFVFLKFDAGRYGRTALAALASQPDREIAGSVAQRATAIQAQRLRYQAVVAARAVTTPEQRAQHVSVIHPNGGTLPESFLRQAWTENTGPGCLSGNGDCDAVLLDLDGDGVDEILIVARPNGVTTAFKADGDRWQSLGVLTNSGCPGVREGFREGKFELKEAPFKDIVIGANRLRPGNAGCVPTVTQSR